MDSSEVILGTRVTPLTLDERKEILSIWERERALIGDIFIDLLRYEATVRQLQQNLTKCRTFISNTMNESGNVLAKTEDTQ